MSRSTAQKRKSRAKARQWVSELPWTFREGGFWRLNRESFASDSSDVLPLDRVVWDPNAKRYRVKSMEDERITDDDAVAHAMVVHLLYRLGKGWGNKRSFQALSIWGGDPPQSDENDDGDAFPLGNRWEEEIRCLIEQRKLGKTTLNHEDNFCRIPPLYGRPWPEPKRQDRWDRRSSDFLGRLHELSEQAIIQLALHVQEHITRDYSVLAALAVKFALEDDAFVMEDLAASLFMSSEQEDANFARVALERVYGEEAGRMKREECSRKRARAE